MKKNFAGLATTFILLLLTAVAFNQSISTSDILGAINQASAPDGYYVVTSVVDGDTFKVDINGNQQTVRLLSIDTPETVDPRKSVQCFGKEASHFLNQLIDNQPVRFEYDSLQGKEDRYGRTLAYVFLEDGTFVNAEMVAGGYAFAYEEIDSDQLDYMIELENEARQDGRGLWSACEID